MKTLFRTSNQRPQPDCTMLPGPTGTDGDQFYVRGAILAPLADNGGPTLTNALVTGGVAIDAADNAERAYFQRRLDASRNERHP